MANSFPPRILVVDDEEAILETMTFTFENDYEVYTSSDARRALQLLDDKAPIAVVLTDQRMPNMSGVEFLAEVCQRHPATVRMILTGFADLDARVRRGRLARSRTAAARRPRRRLTYRRQPMWSGWCGRRWSAGDGWTCW